VTPLFSVIVPTRNRSGLLRRALRSILTQTLQDFEVVVVDDGSTDDTPAVLEANAHPKVRTVRQEHAGTSCARNRGLASARGTFVVFLDDDDEALPTWLASFASVLDPVRCPVARCGALTLGDRGVVTHVRWPTRRLADGTFLAGTFAILRELLLRVGGYVETLRHSENTELSMRLAKAGAHSEWSVAVLDRALVRIHGHHGGPLAHSDHRYGSAKARAAEYMLEWHAELLDAQTRAGLHAIVALDAARDGRFEQARSELLKAWVACPTRWRNLAHLLLLTVFRTGLHLQVKRRLRHRMTPSSGRALQGSERTPARCDRGSPSGPVDLSVLVPSPRAATARSGAAALADQGYAGRWEVIPLEHGLFRPAGAEAKNRAAERARGGFILVIPPGASPGPGWLSNMAALALEWDVVAGDGIGIWKHVLDQVGGWNASCPGRQQDLELCQRAAFCGFRVSPSPDARMFGFRRLAPIPWKGA
jgi:glycosyl transferase family 2